FIGVYKCLGPGAFRITFGFFGCLGKSINSMCVINMFFICTLVNLFAREVDAGAVAVLKSLQSTEDLLYTYTEHYNKYRQNRSKGATVSFFHEIAKCCGTTVPKCIPLLWILCEEDRQRYKHCFVGVKRIQNYFLTFVSILGVATAGLLGFGLFFCLSICNQRRNTKDML
uniref:Tetraspanin n=1 Tax=Xenopus tropicalis TaxID=8364 RepID=A0A6I8SKB2_XENTR